MTRYRPGCHLTARSQGLRCVRTGGIATLPGMAKRERTGFRARLRSVRRRWWATLAVIVLALAGAGAWLGTAGGEDADGVQRITSTVSRGTYKTTVSATGTITPKQDADAAFTSSGTVTSVRVEVGEKVLKGDVLATIDDDSLVAQREAAASQVEAAEAQVDEVSGGSRTQVASAEASLASARSALAQAEEAVENATLRAPFTGVVSAVGYEVGDHAASGSGGTAPTSSDGATAAAITLISPSKLLVEASVPAADITRLKEGLQAEITPTGGGEVVFGTVTEVGVIASASDTGAAQFPVTVAVTGSPTGLYAGASASVAITVAQAIDVLAVPTAAVRTDEDGTSYVTVVDGQEQTRTPVELGSVYGAQTEVLAGVEEGDVIEVLTLSGRRGTGTGGDGGIVQIPGGELPGGGQFPSGGFPGGAPPAFGGNAG